ncbi:MAG: hypothetical protein AABY51_09210 [Deltaproteobacteria bacterium]
MKVKRSLLKLLANGVPTDLKLKAASLDPEVTGLMEPDDAVTVLFVLGYDADEAVSRAAVKSLQDYSISQKVMAMEQRLEPAVIKRLIEMHPDNDAILIMAVLNTGIDEKTLLRLAGTGPEEVANVLAEDIDLLGRMPALVEALVKNPVIQRTLKASLNAMASSSTQAGQGAPVSAPLPVPKDLMDEKSLVRPDEQNMYRMILEMKMAQKLKLALTGNKSAREILVKDSNRLVSSAVLKNPRVTEDEVLRVANSKGASEELLRSIGRNKEWLKNYNVRLGMIANPKTPLTISMKLLDTLNEKDLAKISKSKNIASVLASSARRKVEAKEKK